MKITSRFTVAVHTLLCIHSFSSEYKTTSEFIAGSVNVNPVIIRRTLGQLKDAGFIDVARGTGGASLKKDISDITLLDVYKAVESVDGSLFNFHSNPNPACPLGQSIHDLLDTHLENAQKAMEDSLASVRLSDIIEGCTFQ
jgi:DNA-binding IscR family transcriptional regulator